MINSLLSIFWFFREAKMILFWLYLWQLKEYHLGRFIDHFRTKEGKELLFNNLVILKIFLLSMLSWMYLMIRSKSNYQLIDFFPLANVILISLYGLESVKIFYDFLKKKIRKPVFTPKTLFLLLAVVLFEIFYFFVYFFLNRKVLALRLLFFDVLTPVIVSGVVLTLQPLTAILRLRIIQKARKKREKFRDLLAIGITGSYGKTAVKEFLSAILAEKFKVLKTERNQNSEVGIARCILNNLEKKHRIFIAEMGAYNRGGIKLLCSMVKPKIGILTGINEQHLATFGSQENIIKGKLELIESLPKEGTAILNNDNEIIRELKPRLGSYNPGLEKLLFISAKGKKDVWAEEISVEKTALSFKVFSKDGESAFFRTNLLGVQNIENILLAVCCAKELGMNLSEIAKAFEKLNKSRLGMKILKGVNDINIIDSTYSANPNGVIAHLKYLQVWRGRKAIIMPCLIELGKASQRVHYKIGEEIAKTCNMAIVTKKQCFNQIREPALKAGMKEENILFMEKPAEILEKLKTFSDEEDIVLLEGRISKAIRDLLLSKD